MNIYFKLKKIPLRYRVAAVGWISRFFMGASQIISISILLSYLGTDLYAVFAILTGLQGWFALADYGMGTSLQNYISEARANNECTEMLNSNAVIVSICYLIINCIIFICISPLLQYFLLHKINPIIAVAHTYLLLIVGVMYIAINIFGIAYRGLFANHQGVWAYFYQGIGPIFAVLIIAVIRFMNLYEYRLLLVLLGWLLPSLIASIFGYIQHFSFKNILKNMDFQIIKLLIVRGIQFWIFAVAAAFTLLIDYIVMAQTLMAKDITVYSILSKGFTLILFIYMAILTATWPEMAELFARKNWEQANNILVRNMLFGILCVVGCSLVFVVARGYVIHILAPKSNLVLPVVSIVLFGVYSIIRIWTDSYTVALLSQNCWKLFWIYVPIQAAVSFLGMYYFSLHLGINGIITGLILSYLLTAAWIVPIFYFKRKTMFC